MNKLPLLLAFLGCVLIGTALSEPQLDFPVAACATGFMTGTFVSCIAGLATSIFKLHQWGEDTPITICGNPCSGSIKGRISKLQWKWDGKFQCQNKGQGIIGEGSGKSRNGAMEGAIQEWITKAAQAGSIKVEDFKC